MIDIADPEDIRVANNNRLPGHSETHHLEERIGLIHDEAATAGFARLMGHMTNPETRQRYNTVRRLPLITSPTLVLWGDKDKTNALELGQQTHDLLPDSTLVVFEGVGHALYREAPERFVATVTDFLRG